MHKIVYRGSDSDGFLQCAVLLLWDHPLPLFDVVPYYDIVEVSHLEISSQAAFLYNYSGRHSRLVGSSNLSANVTHPFTDDTDDQVVLVARRFAKSPATEAEYL